MKMINILSFCVLIVTGHCTVLSNVRLVDHTSYMVSVIEETIKRVEKNEWCNLRVNDVTIDLKEDVLGTHVTGKVEFTNGFVASIQWVDIIRNSVQQVWRYNRVTDTTTVEVQGALQLHAVAIGFDVMATLAEGVERYTGLMTHPLLQFDFTASIMK